MSFISKITTLSKIIASNQRGWKSLVWNTSMARLNKAGPLMTPAHIAIEPTNACNAKCPVCETGKDEMLRTKGLLDRKKFELLIDKNFRSINTLMYYFMGEPFLNKNSYDMIKHARSKSIYVETCTNGDLVDAKGVLYSDINKISFQIGGMTEKSHQIYRVNSSLNKVKKNLYELIEEKKKVNNTNVQIDLGFIVMRHNENEVDEFIKWSKEIGVDTANIIDPCVRNMVEGYAYLPKDKKYWFYDEEAFEKGILKPKLIPHNNCDWIWNSMQINWDGEAVPCCRDPNGMHTLGNVFEMGLNNVFNSKKSVDFRKKILSRQKSVGICNLCSSYGLPDLQKIKPKKFVTNFDTINKSIDKDLDKIIDQQIN